MMSLGVPIVSTNVGGIPHFIKDNYNGFLVEPDDAYTMADKLLEVHLCPSIGQKFARNGFEFSRRFREKEVLLKWNLLFNELNGIVVKKPAKTRIINQKNIYNEYKTQPY